jgi:hypothetical protein
MSDKILSVRSGVTASIEYVYEAILTLDDGTVLLILINLN